MLSLYEKASMLHALSLPLDSQLHDILSAHVADLTDDLADLTHYVVIQPGDTEADVVAEIGLSPLVNPGDGARFGSAEFKPWWDGLRRCGSIWEIIICIGDGGFAFILFVLDADGVEPELLSLCRTYAGDEG